MGVSPFLTSSVQEIFRYSKTTFFIHFLSYPLEYYIRAP